jgi:hypothetical protein
MATKLTQPEGKLIRLLGSNILVGTSAETIWRLSNAYTFITTAAPLRIVAGGNAADDASGTGARTITVEGLDSSFNEISSVITTAGASASAATSNSYIRLNNCYVKTVGSGAKNAGNIDIEETGSSTLLGRISAELGVSETMVYTVPRGKTAFIDGLYASRSNSVTSTVHVKIRDAFGSGPTKVVAAFGGVGVIFPISLQGVIEVPEMHDIWVDAFTGSTDSITATLDIYVR